MTRLICGILAVLFAVNVTAQQFARPDSDIDNTGSWTTTPLWSKIDDAVGSGDADQIDSDGTATSTETFTVGTSDVTDPNDNTSHILRLRASKQGGGAANYDCVCELRQGYVSEASLGTLIATVSVINMSTTSATTGTHNMTTGEAGNITDYTDLQFRCWGVKNGGGSNDGVSIYDVELETPDVSTATRRVIIVNRP